MRFAATMVGIVLLALAFVGDVWAIEELHPVGFIALGLAFAVGAGATFPRS